MKTESLEKLLINGREVKIVAMRGSIIDEKYTREANKIAKFMVEKLGLSFGNVQFKFLDNEEFAEKSALWQNPLPTWDTGQNKVINENMMQYRQYSLFEQVGNKFYAMVENQEYTEVFINQNDTRDEILSVIAHVYGHLHVIDNNKLSKTLEINNNKHESYRSRYRKIEEVIGINETEEFYNLTQTLSSLVDIYKDLHKEPKLDYYGKEKDFPKQDVFDVYKFVLDNMTWNGWEKEILDMVYDINQLSISVTRLKIIHEGFASFVENKYIEEVTKEDLGLGWEMKHKFLSVADVLSEPQMPYFLGFRLFQNIEKRWNEGKHGPVYELLTDEEKRNYSKNEGKGLEEILHIVKHNTDWEFIFSYANKDFLKTLSEEIIEQRMFLIKSQVEDSPWGKWILDRMKKTMQEELDPDLMRFELLLRTENYMPMIYIPKGEFLGDNLPLRQDLSFINRYSNMLKKESKLSEEVTAVFSLNNKMTRRSLLRLSKLLNLPVSLETMDKKGQPLILYVEVGGKKVEKIEDGSGPRFDLEEKSESE